MKKYLLTATAMVVVAVAAYSFGANSEKSKVVATNAVVPSVNKPVEKTVAKEGTVAARVNGEIITVEEIKKGYDDNPQISTQVPFDEFYAKAVDIYINGKLVYQAADSAKVQDTNEYKEQLKVAKEDLARKVYMEKVIAEKVNDDAVKKFYDEEYVKNFKSKKEVKAKHILVADENKAKELIGKLNNGADFEKLAKENSLDKAVDLGYFTEEIMVPEFTKAAFSMKKGEYSKTPVKTQFGYHVVMVDDFRDSKPLDLKEIEPQIKNLLTQKVAAETFDNLYKTGTIVKYDLDGKEVPLTAIEK